MSDLTVRPPGLKPLQSYSLADRNQHMSDAADEIGDMASAMAKRLTAAADLKMPDLLTPEIAGIAEAIEGRQGIVGPATKGELRPQRPAVLDIGALPETGYERLVGRDVELKRLDDAWSDGKTNVISLIAEGGAGKSALVNEWLSRLQADNYRGATVVLGWSFFSQGSKERATSADEFLNWALTKLSVTSRRPAPPPRARRSPRPCWRVARSCPRRRRAVAARPRSAGWPAQGPGPARALAPVRGRAAAADHSLIVLTSRVAVADINASRTARPDRRRRETVGGGRGGAPARQRRLGHRDRPAFGFARFRRASARADAAGELLERDAERRRAPSRSSARHPRRRRQSAP